MCLGSFGIQEERVPLECINTKCARLYCAQCVTSVQLHNGDGKRFRCMYCLLEYPSHKAPAVNRTLTEQLWNSMTIKYGIRYTNHLLSKSINQNNLVDLWCDIECRRRHLTNLICTLERFSRWTQINYVVNDTHIMCEKLLDIVTRLREDPATTMRTCQQEYRQLISTSDDAVGAHYIRICERLLADISDAEFYRAFATTHAKMVEWNCALASSDHFQPQVADLFATIEHDLTEQWSQHRHGIVRAKIGIIGYTCVGKSTILNRLLGVDDLTNDEASPVRSIKSTYYQLQFDRREPLALPNDRLKTTAVTLVDVPGT